MATRRWLGGANAVTQVDTLTVAGTWVAGETLTTTLTAEDGTTQAVVSTAPASPTPTSVRDTHLIDLQNATGTLFQRITWVTSGSAAMTGTEKVIGRPFYASLSETSTTGTYTRAATTANVGPNDWESTANWSGSTVPVNADDIDVSNGAHSILYGLRPGNGAGNQGGTPLNLTSFSRGRAFRGSVGDNSNGYYLKLDVNTGVSTVSIDGDGDTIWLNGRLVNVNVIGTSSSPNAVRLAGDIDNLRISGQRVRGKVTVKASAVLDNLYVNDALSAFIEIGTTVTSLDLIEATAGNITTKSGASTLTINCANAAKVIYHGEATEAVSAVNIRGGIVEYNGSGTLTTETVYGGTMSLENNESTSVTITTTTIYGGRHTDQSGLRNVTYTNNIVQHGGRVELDTGYTISKTAA